MFGKKKKAQEVRVAPEPRVCNECGCLVSPRRAKEVTLDLPYSFTESSVYYCVRCAPPYDEIFYSAKGTHYIRIVPEHKQEVTKDGKPVKPKEKAS